MTNIILRAVFSALLFSACLASAQTPTPSEQPSPAPVEVPTPTPTPAPPPQPISQPVNQPITGPPIEQWLRMAGLPLESTSVFIQDVTALEPLVAFNSRQAQNPASLMKLVTTFAALELLGPTFTWKTQVSTQGEQKGDVLRGNVFIKGSGDPTLKLQNAWLMLRQLRLQGIREIRGDLVIDRSAITPDNVDPGQFDGEPLRCYNVAPDALAIAAKCTGFMFRYDRLEDRWRVTADPAPLGLQVEAEIAVGPGLCGDWRSNLTMQFDLDARPPKAVFGGSIPAACGDQQLFRSFFTHRQFSASVLRQLWEGSGGRLTGQVREGAAPDNVRVLAEAVSPQLSEVIRDINKGSLNLPARSLFVALGANGQGGNGGGHGGGNGAANPERGRAAIARWLAGRGWDMPELVLDNGSGLSRAERISAANFGRLLVGAYNSAVMPEFISSLALVGLDGTMQKRLRGTSVAGTAHIKTGSLKDVRAMAGYVFSATGRRFAVVSITNGESLLGTQLIHDQLLSWIRGNG
ncbi:MAG: D-alanyl-D-alanine carboxypeptidase/D-alanyl-D-alanine endopeptidase [Burkholderiaceae bacterium]